MLSAREILDELTRCGAEAAPLPDGRLIVAPARAVNAALINAITHDKAADIVALLNERQERPGTHDAMTQARAIGATFTVLPTGVQR